MEKPIYDVIEPLPLKDDLKSALLGKNNEFHQILLIIKHYEIGNFDRIMDFAELSNLKVEDINAIYMRAVEESSRLYL